MPVYEDVLCDPDMHLHALQHCTTGDTINTMCPWWSGMPSLRAACPDVNEMKEIWNYCIADTPAPTGAELMLTWRCKGAPFFTMFYRGDEVDALLQLKQHEVSAAAAAAASANSKTIFFSHHTRQCYVASADMQLCAEDPPLLVQFICNEDGTEQCIKVIDILDYGASATRSSPRSRVAAMQALNQRWEKQDALRRVSIMWCGDLTSVCIRNLYNLQKSLKHSISSLILLTRDPLSQLHLPSDTVFFNKAQVSTILRPPTWYLNLTTTPNGAAVPTRTIAVVDGTTT